MILVWYGIITQYNQWKKIRKSRVLPSHSPDIVLADRCCLMLDQWLSQRRSWSSRSFVLLFLFISFCSLLRFLAFVRCGSFTGFSGDESSGCCLTGSVIREMAPIYVRTMMQLRRQTPLCSIARSRSVLDMEFLWCDVASSCRFGFSLPSPVLVGVRWSSLSFRCLGSFCTHPSPALSEGFWFKLCMAVCLR